LADEPITLEELADEFGVSRERVRQIEVRAFEKVQKAVKSRIAATEGKRSDLSLGDSLAMRAAPIRGPQMIHAAAAMH
jgi:hypothetical protein